MCDAIAIKEVEEETALCGTAVAPLLVGVGIDFDFLLLTTPAATPIMMAATRMTVIKTMRRILVGLRRPRRPRDR